MSRAPVLVVPELTTPQATGWPTHSGRSAEPPRAQNRSRGAAARPGRCRRFLRRFHMQVRRVSAKRRTPALSCRTAPATPRWPRTRQRWRATLPPRSSVTRSTPRACRSSASRQCSRQCAESGPPRPSCWRHSLPTPAAWDAQLRAEAAPRTPVGRPGRRLDRPSWRRLPPPARDTRSPMPRLPTRRSTHTKDLMAAERTCTEGGKAALCVTAKGFEGAADGRVTLIGDVKRVSDKEVDADGLRALYKAKHPNAYRPHVARSHLGGAAAHRPGPMKQALLAPGCLTHPARAAEQPSSRATQAHPGPPRATHCHPGPQSGPRSRPRCRRERPAPPWAPTPAPLPLTTQVLGRLWRLHLLPHAQPQGRQLRRRLRARRLHHARGLHRRRGRSDPGLRGTLTLTRTLTVSLALTLNPMLPLALT